MRLGIHEAMELHEVMSGKITAIDHHALYISECQDPQLRSILERHQQRMIQDYQKALGFMQGRGIDPTPYRMRMEASIQYGMQAGQPVHPHPHARHLSDQAIASGALMQHKCGATKATAAVLEAADPELRLLFTDAILTCTGMAYEIFQYMNQKGWYQVPAMERGLLNQMTQSFGPVAVHNLEPHRAGGIDVGPVTNAFAAGPQAGETGWGYRP